MNTLPDISILSNYMFSRKNIIKLLDNRVYRDIGVEDKPVMKKVVAKKRVTKMPIDKYILPTHKDTLYWCFFIMTQGQFTYESLSGYNFGEEMKEKILIVEDISNNTDILKKNKWKKTVIEHNLISEKKISLHTFFYMCSTQNINAVVLKGRGLYILENNKDTPCELLVYDDNGYRLSQHDPEEKLALISEYKTTYFNIENINKPIGAVSSYKIADLRDICGKLDISMVSSDGKKYNKKQLYNIISDHDTFTKC